MPTDPTFRFIVAAIKTGVAFIQSGARGVKTAAAGDAVGLVLRGLPLDRVQVGNLLSASADSGTTV